MKVAIVMGSKSDKKIAEKAEKVLKENKISFTTFVASAHRDPEKIKEIAEKDFDVFIAIAGLNAALPGVIASHNKKPVIGVPVSAKLGGLDALLAISQMPKGVPVACVGIDNAENAAYLAIRILKSK
ncbi:MAG: 5-(carboxyamino)imidazole ribonucleotide mutase [Candidatus Diapherotrites archaeon CG10_big_fil_rev_8_21_14_0_10_31_34]|nr:MAG: 5-(carboxyamino)imidazole ribonucleotide mutase [Candidatus Diapherotrites archaeon CG10_big_fil_rev_8_21_14_0_10_31_34]